MAIRFNKLSREFLAILPVSDQFDQAEFVIEIPTQEKRHGGLDPNRKAFLHFDQVNIEPVKGSFHLRKNPKVIGQFSQPFLELIQEKLADTVRKEKTSFVNRE